VGGPAAGAVGLPRAQVAAAGWSAVLRGRPQLNARSVSQSGEPRITQSCFPSDAVRGDHGAGSSWPAFAGRRGLGCRGPRCTSEAGLLAGRFEVVPPVASAGFGLAAALGSAGLGLAVTAERKGGPPRPLANTALQQTAARRRCAAVGGPAAGAVGLPRAQVAAAGWGAVLRGRPQLNARSVRRQMVALANYEREVIRILAGEKFQPSVVSHLTNAAEADSVEHTGVGYFLTLHHPGLPNERHVLSTPMVIGRSSFVECGFVCFVENSELTLECYSWGNAPIPADIRSQDVRITTAA
jgi:hypothetical protein